MFKLASPELLFDRVPLYRILTSAAVSGAHSHKVILVYHIDEKELPSAVKEMLDKLVAACKYKPEDVVYIDIAKEPVNLAGLKERYQPEAILMFGQVTLSRNLPPLKRNVPVVLDGIKLIHAEAPDKLHANAKEKAALWGGLQKMMAL